MSISMTGFGRSRVKNIHGKVNVEIRSVNHKYFDLTTRIPEGCSIFEPRIKEQVHQFAKRGKINLFLACERLDKDSHISVDIHRAKQYYRALKKLDKGLRLNSDIRVEQILLFPKVLRVEEEVQDYNALWPAIKAAVNKALLHFYRMKKREGSALSRDISQRIAKIKKSVSSIKLRLPRVVADYRNKLKQRLSGLDKGISREKFEAEIALFAKNCDVTEEIIRLSSLLNSFLHTLRSEVEIGKKLDFIAQELHREINTVGSKAQDFEISQQVIKVKSEIEKIREQVQNIE